MKKENNKKSLFLNYGNSVLVLPFIDTKIIDRAKKEDIKVLLTVSSCEKYRNGNYQAEIAKKLNIDETAVQNSLSFWNGTGILSFEETENQVVESEEQKEIVTPKRVKANELPEYNTDELNSLLNKHKNKIAPLIEEGQRVMGKIFTVAEVKTIVGLVDYLGLDEEYVLLLMHHCAENDKKSLRYVETLAVKCVDEGILDTNSLQNHLLLIENKKKFENKIRSVFGIDSRALTSKEKALLATWENTYQYSIEIIQMAYEITISAINKPSIPYASSILEKWFTEGLKNVDEINSYIENGKKKNDENKSSYDIDDFIEAALKKTYDGKL